MTDTQLLITVGMMMLGTLITRFLPFICFPDNRRAPAAITYIGKVLPCAAMGLLVVYCLRGVDVLAAPHGLPELLALLVLAAIHLWRRNTLLSIAAGTLTYMLLVQTIFA